MALRGVKSNEPALPVVLLTSPSSGGTFNVPALISINAIAGMAGGTIEKVEFYSGTTKIGEASSSPYSITWNASGAGTYSLTAKAISSSNLTGISAPSVVTVKGPQAANAILTPLSVTSAGFRFRVTGEAGITYRIQSSQDNKLWFTIGSVTLTGDTAEFVDATPGGTHKFYRLVQGL